MFPGHKGRWLAFGIGLLGVASFAFTVPEWVTDPYEYADKRNAKACNDKDSAPSEHLQKYLGFFLIAQAIFGIAASPLYILGVTYIDGNVSQKSSPLYLGMA